MQMRLVAAGLAALLAVPAGGAAQETPPDTLQVAEVVNLVRQANPMVLAARLRADAAAQRVPQAGALPDPLLSVGVRNRPTSNFGTDERMTMNVIQLQQRFPWPGKLGYAQERTEHLALADSWDAREVEEQIVARAKTAYYRLAFMDRSLDVMRGTRELLRSFLDVSVTMYSVGTGLQQDVLQAQVSAAQMTEDITVMEQDRVAMAARLNALLGRDATVPVGWTIMDEPDDGLPEVDSLMALAVDGRPMLAAARARVDAADAGYRAARRAVYPDIVVTLGYGQRPQFADMVTLMAGVSVPIFAGSKQLPLRREMEAMRSQEEARERDLYNGTYAEIVELRAEAVRARNLSQLYATSVLPQARASVESALSAYRVGSVDYMTLVQNELTVNRYEIQTVRLLADYRRAYAEIEALVGGALGGSR